MKIIIRVSYKVLQFAFLLSWMWDKTPTVEEQIFGVLWAILLQLWINEQEKEQ